MTTEQLYIQHKPLTMKAARWAARRWNRTVDEAQDHADFALALILLQHLDDWDPDQLPLKIWIMMRIRWHLTQVYTRGRHPHVENVLEYHRRELSGTEEYQRWERGVGEVPSGMIVQPSRFLSMIREIGEEGKALVQIIRDLPADLWEEIRPLSGRTPSRKEANLRAWLIDSQDWSYAEVDKAIQEVKNCM